MYYMDAASRGLREPARCPSPDLVASPRKTSWPQGTFVQYYAPNDHMQTYGGDHRLALALICGGLVEQDEKRLSKVIIFGRLAAPGL